jgi:hypothetical protein
MASRDELNAKRSQVLHLNKRITHKISRYKNLKEGKHVVLAGGEFDVRKPPKTVRRLTEKQLDAQIARATQFLDRSTQFVPDAHHRPIPSSEFKPLHIAQTKLHDKMQAQLDAKRDTLTSSGTETIGQRRDKIRSDRRLAGNPSVNDPYDPKVNKSTDIADRKALKVLLKDTERKLSQGWDNKELKRQIGEFSKMVDRIGDADLAASVKALSPAQFRTLWNDEGFAAAVSTQYEIVRTTLISEEDKPWHVQIITDAFQDARRMVDWAARLDPATGAAPEPPAQQQQPKKRKRKK